MDIKLNGLRAIKNLGLALKEQHGPEIEELRYRMARQQGDYQKSGATGEQRQENHNSEMRIKLEGTKGPLDGLVD